MASRANRGRLRGVAYRMLGSGAEADDAVQEAWLRVNAAGADGVENLGAWLMTVTARVCLNMLRSRQARREEPLAPGAEDRGLGMARTPDPETEAILADSLGVALQVVLDTLSAPERLAFVLHDLFGVPFDEIAPILGRSATAARQLASRARRRVQAAEPDPVRRHPHRALVDAFLTAARGGDVTELLSLLDPGVVLTADAAASGVGAPRVVRGAEAVIRGATAFPARARWARPALINGKPGMVLDPGGKLLGALTFDIEGGRITAVDIIGDADRLAALSVESL